MDLHKFKSVHLFLKGLKNNLEFTTKERQGLFGFVLIVFLVIIGLEIYLNTTIKSSLNYEILANTYEEMEKKTLFQDTIQLEINEATALDFQSTNKIHAKLANRIVKFRKSIKGFSKLEDLKKVYGMSDSIYLQILPNLYINSPKNSNPIVIKKTPVPDPIYQVDINEVGTDYLVQNLKINKIIAQRIIKYRNVLGRFDSLNQLNDVYNVSQQDLELIKKSTVIIPEKIKPRELININTASSEKLMTLKHMRKELANRIVKYKKLIGRYDSIPQLKNVYGINDTLYHQISSIVFVLGDSSFQKTKTPKIESLDINTANQAQLDSLKRIPTYLAKRIINYRRILGGFYEMDQLKNVYNINAKQLEVLYNKCEVKSPHQIHRFDTISFKFLLRFNILNMEEVRRVYDLKNEKDSVVSKDDFLNTPYVPKEKLHEISQYLIFEK